MSIDDSHQPTVVPPEFEALINKVVQATIARIEATTGLAVLDLRLGAPGRADERRAVEGPGGQSRYRGSRSAGCAHIYREQGDLGR